MIKKFDILVKRLTKSKFAGILGYCMWDKKKIGSRPEKPIR